MAILASDAAFTRRQFLTASTMSLIAPLLACTQPHGLLKISRHTWPGYMLLDLARERGWLPEEHFRLIDLGSAKGTLRALAANSVDIACLTLDEVLAARADGLELMIIGLINFSRGADVVISRKPISLRQLASKSIAFESGAVGQVMLHQLLKAAQLSATEVKLIPVNADEQLTRFTQGEFDVLITYEPIASKILSDTQFQPIYSSRECPDLIVDVFASTQTAIQHHGNALNQVLNAHYRAQLLIKENDQNALQQLAAYLSVSLTELRQILAGLELCNKQQAAQWLNPASSRIESTVQQLQDILHLKPANSIAIQSILAPQFLAEP